MRPNFSIVPRILSYAVILLFSFGSLYCTAPVTSLSDYVDPLIGTGTSTTPSALRHSEADNEPRGQTFPAVGFPFGMTQWTPQTHNTEQKCFSPYYYSADSLSGFRGSHWMSGSCTQDYGSVTIMPIGSELIVEAEMRKTPFSHDDEAAHPYYYSVYLPDEQIQVDMTGHRRSGFLRFEIQGDQDPYIVVEPNSDEGAGYVHINLGQREITGYNPAHRIYQGWGQYAGFNGYFVIQFDRGFSSAGTWENGVIHEDRISIRGDSSQVGAYVQFSMDPGEVVHARIGTSFTSIEAARENLRAEIPEWSFETTMNAAKTSWDSALSSIEVTANNNGTLEDLTTFYTAHYHAMMLPRVFSNVNGTYPGFADDTLTHTIEGYEYYADFSVWDTYRAVHPLLTITQPQRARDMVQSLVLKAEQGGWLPIFPSWNNYTAAMIGDHVMSIITDAYMKGLTDFDVALAYSYMYQNATEVPPYEEYVDGKGRRALLPYLEYGFMPLEEPITEAFHQEEQVSRTLEYAYNDFTIGLLAHALGKDADAEEFLKRAMYYRNIIDPETGISRGRYRDGSWYTPFDPSERTYPFITEGSPWHYTWYVPHDVAGLIERMGGRESFVSRLDTLFHEGEYWHGNEPSHQIAYMYAYAGAPWKSQHIIREIMRDEYSSGPGGLSGNDDAGQMSAWYVFSAIGFYPVAPGLPYYVIGTPSFEEVVIHGRTDHAFTIRALGVSDENRYIQSATLNGEPLNRPWILHEEITRGGILEFEMSSTPNEEWGSSPDQAPPSLSSGIELLYPELGDTSLQ